jgi:hypothetical protein
MQKMMQEIDDKDGDRIHVSICRKAYDALVTDRQVNEKDNDIQKKPLTIQEILDEELIFLSDSYKLDVKHSQIHVRNYCGP